MILAAFGFLWKTSIFIGAILAIILVLLFFFQNKILYIPNAPNRALSENPQGYRNPGESEMPFEDIFITTQDNVKLHGWIVKMPNPKAVKTIIYFHENAGNIGYRIPFMKYFQRFCNVNVILVAYRGFSSSEGVPTEAGLQKDVMAVIDHAFNRTDIDTTRIFIFGRSLGGAAGIYGVSNTQHKVCGLILENTFTSISDMVDIMFSKLASLKSLVLRNHWHSLTSISSITIPILFISGMKDELIPSIQMAKLYNAAQNARFKEKHEVHAGTHNDTWAINVDEYFKQINAFMDKCQKGL